MSSSTRLEDADWLTLADGDEIEWTGRPSLLTVAPQLLAAFVVGFGGAVAISTLDSVLQTGIPASLRVLPIFAGLGIFAVVFLRWYRVQYVITSAKSTSNAVSSRWISPRFGFRGFKIRRSTSR